MRKIFKNLKRRESGFTLIEVLVAVAILAIVGVGLLGGLILSSKTLLMANSRETARDVAEAQMENIQSQTYQTASPDYTEITASGYTITTSAVFINQDGTPPTPTTYDTGLQKITVTVVGPKGDFTLEGYKVDY
jgi:prepilin-type N-terminal cleavage/methylation domain-containing protein